ncbi:FAD-dependent oxidoreductase [Desulforhopalus singaporensis]|uniref:NADPH-dependent glutamate synthase beta chain n=1 Tax=Desulforhopalus singaporensis TaxID=91360 RepID=A0A1H0Q8Y1_9BACT|nr:FAD-dependent oxidoreductase [Desulforhopalus singaporensis]SDP13485.1 NADPH-dependent glutamate synthase beta chain [Desulforhopalus singaporensis]
MKPTNIDNPEYFHKVIDCQYACPSHTPVPEYLRLITQGKYDEAYKVNWISNVFPGVLGRICDRPCEPACRRGRVEENPVAICRLKRVTYDYKSSDTSFVPAIPKKKNGKKIALVGGGPASLTVARDLLPLGYEIDLYDDQSKAGGFIRTQVPSFRLPEKVLNEEVDRIIEMGINTHFNHYVDSLKKIIDKNYDAIFIGTGAPRGRDLPDLPGREAGDSSIFIGIQWLAAILYRHITNAPDRVLVLGGGNTAMDCCRMAKRLGAQDVKVMVRSPREQMKASPWEIEDAIDEGIPIIDNHSPVEFVVKAGKLVGMHFQKVQVRYTNDGKKELVPLDAPPVFYPCDLVLLAVGQMNAFPYIEEDIGIEMNERGTPKLDKITHQSTVPHIFFGGDAAFGPRNVITAVAHGHEAAISIDIFCRGKDLHRRPAPKTSLLNQTMGMQEWLYDAKVTEDRRYAVPTVDRVKSLKNRLVEVELGFSKKTGHQESFRCLNCDVQTVFDHSTCIECDACVDICPESCINFIENASEEELRQNLTVAADNPAQALYVSDILPTGRVMVKDENVCLHCGLCAERCPTASWEMKKYTYNSAEAGDKIDEQD